jgi:hypothetical protein
VLWASARDQLGFEERNGEMRMVPIRAESPFARHRGIGNPQIGFSKGHPRVAACNVANDHHR